MTNQDVYTTLRYLSRDPKYAIEKPYRLVNVAAQHGIPETNMKFETFDGIHIKDFRNTKNDFRLETTGFQLCSWPSNINTKATYEEVESYCKAMEDLVIQELHAAKVFTFDFRFRLQNLQKTEVDGTPSNQFGSSPVHIAHIDQTQEGGMRRIGRHLTVEEYGEYISDRWRIRIVNVWRSFNTTPCDLPLAVCMPHTVSPADFIDLVGPEQAGESYYLHHNPNYKWCWASDMQSSEAMHFVTWDSENQPKGPKGVCHSAFPDPRPGANLSPRESLEVRLIVINPA